MSPSSSPSFCQDFVYHNNNSSSPFKESYFHHQPEMPWPSSEPFNIQYPQSSYNDCQDNNWTSTYGEDLGDFLTSFSPSPSEESVQRSVSTKWQRKRQYELTLPLHVQKKRRMAANARERKRMNNLNHAFERLRDILPLRSDDTRPISKMEALQMANTYIKELSSLLSTTEFKN